jgi:FkbM family methyltransferase
MWNIQYSNTRYSNNTYFNPSLNEYFSQYNQDRSLENCIFKGVKNGFFMDIGAHDGVDLNNTLYFEKNNNWRGINVEPIPDVYKRLLTNRPNSININCAIDEKCGNEIFCLNHGYSEMLSGLKKDYDPRHLDRINNANKEHQITNEEILVETRTITSICNEYNIKNINYLTIDVEGAEMSVLKSIDFDTIFIDVIGYENNYNDISYIPINYLKSKGYILLPPHIGDIFMIHEKSQFIKNLE